MRHRVLASDYDGTIAENGTIDAPTLAALVRLRDSGRALVLVTGRELDDLLNVVPEPRVFDRIVAENGVVLYRPATRETLLLAEPPPDALFRALAARGVPFSRGRVIVSTHARNEAAMLDAIRESGLALHAIRNKDALMVLPSGQEKTSGLAIALTELGLSRDECVGVGDAENDLAFLSWCARAVAVANALPAVKAASAVVTTGAAGAGVRELVDALLREDDDDEARSSRPE
jgi:hydroxymethylpyrimidine pyrophosphatase-like HAD family hydrolase